MKKKKMMEKKRIAGIEVKSRVSSRSTEPMI